MRSLDLDALVRDRTKRIIVCCGSGGVGKTTLAAALALRGAELGRRTVVLTIDPARRLAQALGLEELDNTPHPVPGINGELHAMMLDMKSTLDDMVLAYAKPERAEEILTNPFYESISSSLAGTQEYMAREKLGQLAADTRWDVIVVDTPPSRSALDFLDAPRALAGFWDSRMARLLVAPARASGRGMLKAFSLSLTLVHKVLSKVVGAQLLKDAGAFMSAAESLFGGFQQRAERTYALLAADQTAFVVIAAPRAESMDEASYFADRLVRDDMPFAGFVVNRVVQDTVSELDAGASLRAAQVASSPVAAAALRLHAGVAKEATHQQVLIAELAAGHPDCSVATISGYNEAINDLDDLRGVFPELEPAPAK
ncbi:MAG: ArsA family ATPase [Corynebacteriales bacterium]|nr:ArsA family ATPase [Mycobacteriales bacterium]